jgi:hypothetical protein
MGTGASTDIDQKWFGFAVHVVADTRYELPPALCLTKASRNEKPVMRKLLRRIERRIPGLRTCAHPAGPFSRKHPASQEARRLVVSPARR